MSKQFLEVLRSLSGDFGFNENLAASYCVGLVWPEVPLAGCAILYSHVTEDLGRIRVWPIRSRFSVFRPESLRGRDSITGNSADTSTDCLLSFEPLSALQMES